jgi:hypothetical protein
LTIVRIEIITSLEGPETPALTAGHPTKDSQAADLETGPRTVLATDLEIALRTGLETDLENVREIDLEIDLENEIGLVTDPETGIVDPDTVDQPHVADQNQGVRLETGPELIDMIETIDDLETLREIVRKTADRLLGQQKTSSEGLIVIKTIILNTKSAA